MNNIQNLEIQDLIILNYSREYTVDIRRQCLSFNIYENIYSSDITFSANINDSNGLIERFPFTGEELIYIRYNLKNDDEVYDKLFSVYKISNRQENKERNESYTIHGISLEKIIDTTSVVDNSFIGIPFSEMVKRIYQNNIVNNFLRHGLKSENDFITYTEPKELFVEDSLGAHSIVSPLKSPYELIKYCAKQAQSIKYDESDFIFFENKNGFHFKTISSLIDSDIKETFWLANPSVETKIEVNMPKPYQIIEEISYKSYEFDSLLEIYSGLYDNTVSIIDPILKTYEDKTFNYHDAKNFDGRFTNLGKYSFLSEYAHQKTYKGNSHRRLMISNNSDIEYNQTSYIKGRTIDRFGNILDTVSHYPFVRHKFLNEGISKSVQLNTRIVLTITIVGNLSITVGDTIDIFIPQRSATEEFLKSYNLFYGTNPKFLIASVRHNYDYSENKYRTILEVIKDSLGNQLVQTDRQRQDIIT